ncbi:MAG: recombinase family protein, partial [Firmicutes bacterium]|nr:recombinase family protein [Bacillota bacterium]
TYDKIEEAEELLVSAKAKRRSLLADKITGDNIYKALIFFDKLYDKMCEAEKREFLSQLVDNVQIYEERKENGQWLKSIEFKLPIIEKEFTLSLDNNTQNETVVLISQLRQKPDDYIDVDVDVAELEGTSADTKATYEKIKKYVAEHYDGMKVSSLNIAQVKRKCGLELAENFNLPKSDGARQPQCPKEKEVAIVGALKAFKMI